MNIGRFARSLRQRRSMVLLATVMVMVMAASVTHLAASGAAESGPEMGEAGEGAAVILPPILGPLGALLVLAVTWAIRRRHPGAAWFALLPPAAFVFQELAEQLLGAQSIPGGSAEPSLAATLALQGPFALLAFAVGRLLLGAARQVIRLFRASSALRRPSAPLPIRLSAATLFTYTTALAGAHFGRAPPHLL